MNGWRGKILWVDLSQGKLRIDPLNPQVAKDYIDGRGVGDPLSKPVCRSTV